MLAAVEPLRTFDTELVKLNVGPVTMPATWPAGTLRYDYVKLPLCPLDYGLILNEYAAIVNLI